MRSILVCLGAIMALSGSADAREEYFLKNLPNSTTIIVWESADAQGEALTLISAGVHKTNPALIDKLIACWVEPGTRVVVTDVGFVTHDIMVIEGPQSGCRGNIPAEELRHGTSSGPGGSQ